MLGRIEWKRGYQKEEVEHREKVRETSGDIQRREEREENEVERKQKEAGEFKKEKEQ